VLTSKPQDGRKRFARGQKFALSAAGAEAADAYRATVQEARTSGRAALDAALVAWASPRKLAPADGVILSELAGKPVGLSRLAEALEPSGMTAEEIRAGVGRLIDAGILELVPLASQLPA
jgi:hypothetical protein